VKRLLIANRGEIAERLIHACREYGISPVGVYSEADRDAPYVAQADAAVCVGPGPAGESYLNAAAILEAAKTLEADALHPGYGFLSENAEFADACAAAGLTFVGPPGAVIRSLGNKSAAKQWVSQAGVPVVPGYSGDDQTEERLAAEAERIGLPLLIKAAAGGGGRGMRLVTDMEQFRDAIAEARQEATHAFKNGQLLLERYIERSRHIEFQIFGDRFGNVVHLGERDCSIQRRHQKIIEESPAPNFPNELRHERRVRERMGEAAVAAARSVGYENAGTVEFLVEEGMGEEPTFYFLEVNTRLQVEHPVTETVTGQDLVRWQLLVADGFALPLTQSEIHADGVAIEARIYAEDPASGFLPAVGVITAWEAPTGPGIRVDSGYGAGSVVPPYYDPMLAKVIAYAATREQAIARLEKALRQFTILGIRTNIAYLLAILGHAAFREGRLWTGFLAEHFKDWKPGFELPEEVLLALAADVALPQSRRNDPWVQGKRADSPWEERKGWRNVP
jgi:acetyl-CoA carboxylase biotin carboxylase subunit